MDSQVLATRQAHRLIQVGVFLFLVGLIEGLLVPLFAVPRLGVSAHLLAITQGIFLVVLGLVWPRLHWSDRISRMVFWMVIYGCFSAWTANILGAILGAGNTMLPIAAGQAKGSPGEEMLITILLRSAALCLIASVVLVLWGLRAIPGNRHNDTAAPAA